jgi:hypothetical protein
MIRRNSKKSKLLWSTSVSLFALFMSSYAVKASKSSKEAKSSETSSTKTASATTISATSRIAAAKNVASELKAEEAAKKAKVQLARNTAFRNGTSKINLSEQELDKSISFVVFDIIPGASFNNLNEYNNSSWKRNGVVYRELNFLTSLTSAPDPSTLRIKVTFAGSRPRTAGESDKVWDIYSLTLDVKSGYELKKEELVKRFLELKLGFIQDKIVSDISGS